jgi:glutamyl/glutaminyl-tRNA synthetase
VVVDDLRQDVDLVVRGRDLLATTPVQIRSGAARASGCPTFAHHRLSATPTVASCRRPTERPVFATCGRPE